MQRIVDGVQLFTRLLDGGRVLVCACGFIYRAVEPSESCPSCGRGQHHANPASVDAYRADRAGVASGVGVDSRDALTRGDQRVT